MKKDVLKSTAWKKREPIFLLGGGLILLASLYPYWLFLDLSTLGWYDEFHALVPWYFSKALNNISAGFMHGYAGGTGGALGFVYGNELVSFYRWLVSNFELWQAQFYIRFLGFTFQLVGVYLFARINLRAPALLSLACALFSILISNIPYGWTIGGTGWDLGVVAWLCLVLFYPFKHWLSRFGAALCVSMVAAATCAPVFLFPLAVYTFIYCVFLIETNKTLKLNMMSWSGVWLIFFTVLLANWYDAQHSIGVAKAFSARIQGVLNPQTITLESTSLFDQLVIFSRQAHQVFISFSVREPNPLLNIGYAIVVLMSLIYRQLFGLLLFAVFAYVLPVVLDTIAKFTGVDVIANYRWTTVWLAQPLLISFYIAYQSNRESNISRSHFRVLTPVFTWFCDKKAPLLSLVAVAMIVTSGIAATRLIEVTMNNLNATGGLGATVYYDSLRKLKHAKNHYRFISADSETSGVIPLFYGLDTFDGMLTNFPYRRNYFLAYAAYEPAKDTLHTHSHFLGGFPNGFDIDMFRMANVRYVISGKVIEHAELHDVDYMPAVFANDISYPFKHYLNAVFDNQRLINPLYIYELDGTWPRVFAAKRLLFTDKAVRSKAFYTIVKSLAYAEVVAAIDDRPEDYQDWVVTEALQVKEYNLNETGATIKTNRIAGVLVFNQVYTAAWRAQCDDRMLTLVPVNGVMMAMRVPEGCGSVHLTYQLPI